MYIQIGEPQGAHALVFDTTNGRIESHGTVSDRELGVHTKMNELRLHIEAFLLMDQIVYCNPWGRFLPDFDIIDGIKKCENNRQLTPG